jgi:hypothetical protein
LILQNFNYDWTLSTNITLLSLMRCEIQKYSSKNSTIVTKQEADEKYSTPEEREKKGDYYYFDETESDLPKAVDCYKQALELKRCDEEAMRSELICLRIQTKLSIAFAIVAVDKIINSTEEATNQLKEAYGKLNNLGDLTGLNSVWDWELEWERVERGFLLSVE